MADEEPWYRRFGDLIAPAYSDGDETSGSGATAAEVAFIEREMLPHDISSPWRILDVGCGTGRHARMLASRGHHVTGVDCSPGLLAVARHLAIREGLTEHDGRPRQSNTTPEGRASGTGHVRWVESDARALSFMHEFDLALSLYGGAFGLGADEDDDEAVLRNIARALVPGGLLVLMATNAAGLVYRFAEQVVMTASDDDAPPPFDPVSFTTHTKTVAGPDGNVISMPAWWRAYTARELVLLCRLCGLHVERIYGCSPGDWQQRSPRLTDPDVLAIARKSHAWTP